jgi:lysophospholipase L1-like esterase
VIRKSSIKKSFVSLVALAFLLSLVLPGSVDAKTVKKGTLNYVALGDSLAAGYVPDASLGRAVDKDGYPDYLEDRLEQSNYDTHLHNFGVGGYKTTDVLAQLNQPTVLAQVMNADIITLDIGANDALGALANPALAQQEVANALVNIGVILGTIRHFNPEAKVYVMGYYNPFPFDARAQLVDPLLDIMNTNLEAIAGSFNTQFVPTADVVAENYQSYLTPFDIHLTEEGYKAVSKEFWKALVKTKGWKQTDGE